MIMGKRIIGAPLVIENDYYTSIHSYAYMNPSLSAKGWWWILFSMLPTYPRLLRQILPLWGDEMHPAYQRFVTGLKGKAPGEMATDELWQISQEIVTAAMY